MRAAGGRINMQTNARTNDSSGAVNEVTVERGKMVRVLFQNLGVFLLGFFQSVVIGEPRPQRDVHIGVELGLQPDRLTQMGLGLRARSLSRQQDAEVPVRLR